MNSELIDVTPHPTILTVLGEIELRPWQCLAELIDNSIDGFLKRMRAGDPIEKPRVNIALGQETVVVKDNGPGMSIKDLELAVKAGWSSNDRFGNLGLYGIGFNIATARLGSLTKIWTTRAGDEEWVGLDIDLPKMATGGSYLLKPLTRIKADPNTSGTEIEVSRLRSEWKGSFLNTQWVRNNISEYLSKVYSTMLRSQTPLPIGFSLYMNNKKIEAWQHCIWPADWDVYRKNEGLVRPVQEINQTFGIKYLSKIDGKLYDSLDNISRDDVIEVPERIYGWIGIQRYADNKEFGIDLIRNGRKIEIGCKSLFEWDDVLEYPIDDPRNRGRIVGEIHLDHGYVFYTKHRFEREHSSWKQLLNAIRNNEPLINRPKHGFPEANNSPLGLLFRVFRRNSPLSKSNQTWRDILFIQDNDKARLWADSYRKGITEYLDNNKWKIELEGEESTPTSTDEYNIEFKESDSIETDIGLDTGISSEINSITTSTNQPTNIKEIPPGKLNVINETKTNRIIIPQLSSTVSGIGLSSRVYVIEVYDINKPLDSFHGTPWKSRITEKGVFEVEIQPKHPSFNSASFQLRDAILAEFAHYITSEEVAAMGVRDGTHYGEILVSLRNKFSAADSLGTNEIRSDIDSLRKKLIYKLANKLSEDSQENLLRKLSPEDQQRVELSYALGAANAKKIDFLEVWHIASLLQSEPSLFFDDRCFKRDWNPSKLGGNTDLLAIYQKQLMQDVWISLTKIGEFANPLTPPLELSRSYLVFVRACMGRIESYMSSLDEIYA
ncbi:hypothetical protein F8S13_03365 [Chloroflexia bacterium SDU3-3]|nr:hypothetical protein F8S13_03365 [Chloroflexia bacterium SDU3-3]